MVLNPFFDINVCLICSEDVVDDFQILNDFYIYRCVYVCMYMYVHVCACVCVCHIK